MDDNAARPVVEFPFNGRYLAVKMPSESQMMLVALSHSRENPQKLIKRLLSLIENLIGSEEWDRIEDLLMSEQIEVTHLMDLLGSIVKYPWSNLAPVQAEPGPEAPAPVPDEVPQPRVVKSA